ncbi:uncharacterized protein LOC131591643 isoform X2 [Poecile atricapillus]|uniref:uncharacterized protein LOC131591643 isoform X2 n=1 Tax=Poecile atricapillus TaxID=48891 RepID=UPI0027394C61|nr:uncharacterized protein LOC131591643 isoform X2 [Poecile atricapillus]
MALFGLSPMEGLVTEIWRAVFDQRGIAVSNADFQRLCEYGRHEGFFPVVEAMFSKSAWDALGDSLLEALLLDYEPRLVWLLGIWWQCVHVLCSHSSSSASSVATLSDLDERGDSYSSCGSEAELSLCPGDAELVDVASPRLAPRRCWSGARMDSGWRAVRGTTERGDVTPPRPAPWRCRAGVGSPPWCALPAQADGEPPQQGAAPPLGVMSGTVPCPRCGWAVSYPTVGDGASLGSVVAHAHTAPKGGCLVRSPGFCAPDGMLLGALPSVVPPASDLCSVGTGGSRCTSFTSPRLAFSGIA